MEEPGDEARLALLGHQQEDELWDAVEMATPADLHATCCVRDILDDMQPKEAMRLLQTSCVKKLGEFSLPDHCVMDKLGSDSIITMGADRIDIDYEAEWRCELKAPPPGLPDPDRKGGALAIFSSAAGGLPAPSLPPLPWHDAGVCVWLAGWSSDVQVIAYCVTVKDAAAPDKDGLLQPLLRRWQAGACSFSAFALPPVQAVIDWKWEKFARKL